MSEAKCAAAANPVDRTTLDLRYETGAQKEDLLYRETLDAPLINEASPLTMY